MNSWNNIFKEWTRGLEMMKATAAVHVSIDYADEKDFVKKYRMANILHPIFAFLCSNTKNYAGKENHDIYCAMIFGSIQTHPVVESYLLYLMKTLDFSLILTGY